MNSQLVEKGNTKTILALVPLTKIFQYVSTLIGQLQAAGYWVLELW
jgi:hypothetical protein